MSHLPGEVVQSEGCSPESCTVIPENVAYNRRLRKEIDETNAATTVLNEEIKQLVEEENRRRRTEIEEFNRGRRTVVEIEEVD